MEQEEKKNTGYKKYLIIASFVLGGFFVLYITTNLVSRLMVTMTKAAPSNKVSIQNSYILGNKLLATADGRDKALINVFVLDKDGKGINGKNVTLTGADKIVPEYGISDSEGKVVFGVMSSEEKQYVVSAVIEGQEIGKNVVVTFRN